MNKTIKRHYTRLAWEMWYQMAEEYYQINQNLKIPVKYKTVKGFALGRWIERQRAAYHMKGGYRIDLQKIYLLNQLEMEWSLGIRTQWDIWYQYCVQYYASNGNLNIPKDFEMNGLLLGEWLIYQRKRYKQNKMSMEQIGKLELLNMKWKVRIRREWEEWFQEAKCYYDENGNLEVPFRYISESGCKLGDWIHRQREAYRGTKKNSLDAERILQLNQIGMCWNMRQSRQKVQEAGERIRCIPKGLHISCNSI